MSLNQSEEYAKAVVTYLSLSLDMLAAFTNKLARWENTSQAIKHIFALQAIPMLWTYVESNPFSRSSGSWENGWGNYIKVIEQCAKIKNTPAIITQGSATALKYQDNYFDAIFTDPPYYDNIPYSHLSDFFYVWLKRSIGDLYPELFSTELVPKRNEIVAYSDSKQDSNQGKNGFESMLKKSFQEIHRILKPNGIAVIIYTHKSNEGWESLINSLLDSELIISAAWPVNTEMQTRLRAKESATLASSIYIIARKMKRKSPVLYNQIRDELMTNLNLRMNEIWNEGISGADFMISAIGLSIPIYGKFEKVIDYEGNSIRADKYLEDVRAIVMDFSIKQILHSNLSEGLSNLTKYYLFWRVNFGESEVIFDEANKLARSCSLDISQTTSFIKKNKENISILGPHQRDLELIKGSNELIDVLHTVLLYWEKSMRDDITNHLKNTGFGKSEMFYKIAQAISETLPNESKEKKLLDGFLAGKERMKDEVKKEIKQKSLDEMIKR